MTDFWAQQHLQSIAHSILSFTLGASEAIICLQLVAEETEHFTGAELEGLCREAALSALREDLQGAQQVAAKHFASVRMSMKPGLNPVLLQSYASFKQ